MGSVRSVFSSQSSTATTPPTNNFNFNLILDSGCTGHMFPHKELFISYKETPNSFIILADKSKVSCLGSGTVRLSLQNKPIILHDVLHVPKLRSPLLSIRCFRWLAGCSFIADNNGSYLTFPNFILPLDDSIDCTIPGKLYFSTKVDFDSRNTGSVTAVSDNTHFKNNRHPILSSTQMTTSKTTPSITKKTSSLHLLDSPTTDTNIQTNTYDDDIIDDASESSPIATNLSLPTTSSSPLSSTQIQEISTAILNHLKKHGKITMELINFIKDGYSSQKNSTSSTPNDHATLPSSDKMSNTAPKHVRYTIQELSCYFRFRSLKNWDTLHDVCQPNFSFVKSIDLPLGYI
jgi:hypothetical protein